MFAERLRSVMRDRGIKQVELVAKSGLTAASISQYVNGRNKPSEKSVKAIAEALDVPEAYLLEDAPEMRDCTPISGVGTLTVSEAARLMGKNQQFVRIGLQRGILPFGYAINVNGKRFSYFISARKFTEYTGIDVT